MGDELTRDTEFFLSPNIKQELKKDFKNCNKKLLEINLEVQAYGSFRPKELFEKFAYAAIAYLRHFRDLSIIKIQVAGFPKDCLVGSAFNLGQIFDLISEISSKDLRRIILNFPNFYPGTVADFSKAIALASNPNFVLEEVVLNFANWEMDLDLKRIESELRPIFQMSKFHLGFDYLRLQMSGWYYKNYNALFGDYNGLQVDPKVFRDNVSRLHETVKRMFEALFKVCKTQVIIDLRNWNAALDMVNMKKKVDKLTKQGSYQKSLVQTKTEESKLFKITFLV